VVPLLLSSGCTGALAAGRTLVKPELPGPGFARSERQLMLLDRVRPVFPAPEDLGHVAFLQMACFDCQDLIAAALDAADVMAGQAWLRCE
jgi:hypothetical protein